MFLILSAITISLSCFSVISVFVTETAELFYFHTIRVVLFLFSGVVIALLAHIASQSDF